MRAALAVSLKLASKEDSGRGLNREMPADQDKQAIHRAVHAEVCDKLGRAQKVSHQGPASLKGMPSMRTCLYPVQMSKPENLPGGWSWTRWAGPGGSGGLGVCPPLQIMLKILQARLQQYVNRELPDVQAGFRKGRGTKEPLDESERGEGKSWLKA